MTTRVDGSRSLGSSRRLLRSWAFVATSLVALFVCPPAFAFDIPELMTLLARTPSGEARFVEERSVNGIDQPLRSSGKLRFAAPDHLTRETTEPRPETMTVVGNTVTMARGGRSRSLALDAEPEVAAIVEAIRGTLTGNAERLQRYFRPALSGDVLAWSLDLTPIDARLASRVAQVLLSGHDGVVQRVEVQLADGDRSVMTIEPMPAAASASAASTP